MGGRLREEKSQKKSCCGIKEGRSPDYISPPAVLVIADMIQIDLLACEQKRIFDGGGTLSCSEVCSRTMENWQEPWEQDGQGRWMDRKAHWRSLRMV